MTTKKYSPEYYRTMMRKNYNRDKLIHSAYQDTKEDGSFTDFKKEWKKTHKGKKRK